MLYVTVICFVFMLLLMSCLFSLIKNSEMTCHFNAMFSGVVQFFAIFWRVYNLESIRGMNLFNVIRMMTSGHVPVQTGRKNMRQSCKTTRRLQCTT